MENKKNDTSDRELRLSRLLDAPVDLVWEVWTKPEHLAQWWGPNGFTNTISQMEVRPGGEFNLVMHGPDGTDYDNKNVFTEVVLHRKLVYKYLSAPVFLATIGFEARGEQTLLTWHMVWESAEEFIRTAKAFKADEGLMQTVERLAGYVVDFHKTH